MHRKPVEITVIGDSLALGTGASRGTNGFAFRLYSRIVAQRPGSEITNYAIGGAVASDVLRLEVDRIRERRADCIIVCVGGNDVIRQTSPESFGSTYRALLTGVRARASHARIVVLGVPDVSISPILQDRGQRVRALARELDGRVRFAARDAHAAYVDLFALTQRVHDPATYLSADHFHPCDRGHDLIARAALPVLEAALNARQ